MASSSAKSIRQLLSKNSAVLKRGAEHARQEIFGHVPIIEGASTGNRTAKKAFTGSYLEKYYPVSINHYARKVRFVHFKIARKQGISFRVVPWFLIAKQFWAVLHHLQQ